MPDSPPPFVPPEKLPEVAPTVAAPSPPTPVVPPPSGLPPVYAPPAEPTFYAPAAPPAALQYSPQQALGRPARSRRKSAIIVSSIIGGSLVLLTGLVLGVFALANTIVEATAEFPLASFSEEEPLLEGEPSAPTAAEPVVCPDACFRSSQVGDTIGSRKDYAGMGVTSTVEPWGAFSPSFARAEYRAVEGYWVEQGGSPDACFVTFFDTPIAVALGDKPETIGDKIYFTGTHADDLGNSQLSHTVRLFDDSNLAVAHMNSLDTLLRECSYYEAGRGNESWSAEVTPFPALDLPPSVAAVGWVESSPYSRYYAVDLQRGNLVVRNTLTTWSGDVTEKQFRTYAENLARQLAELPLE